MRLLTPIPGLLRESGRDGNPCRPHLAALSTGNRRQDHPDRQIRTFGQSGRDGNPCRPYLPPLSTGNRRQDHPHRQIRTFANQAGTAIPRRPYLAALSTENRRQDPPARQIRTFANQAGTAIPRRPYLAALSTENRRQDHPARQIRTFANQAGTAILAVHISRRSPRKPPAKLPRAARYGLLGIKVPADTLSFTKRPGTSALTYAIQESTDLGIADAWYEVTGGSYTNNASTISYTPPASPNPRNFLRLRVTRP